MLILTTSVCVTADTGGHPQPGQDVSETEQGDGRDHREGGGRGLGTDQAPPGHEPAAPGRPGQLQGQGTQTAGNSTTGTVLSQSVRLSVSLCVCLSTPLSLNCHS